MSNSNNSKKRKNLPQEDQIDDQNKNKNDETNNNNTSTSNNNNKDQPSKKKKSLQKEEKMVNEIDGDDGKFDDDEDVDLDDENLVFIDEEDVVVNQDDSNEEKLDIPEGERIDENENNNMNEEGNNEEDENIVKVNESLKVWNPKDEPLKKGEVLEYDSSAYDMLHFMAVGWPCLSFDILKDNLGVQRSRYPHTVYLVAGTQADVAENNEILVMKMSDLHRTKYDNGSDSGSESHSDDMGDDPILEYKSIPHPFGGINKIRAMPQQTHIVATFSDDGQVNLWDFQKYIEALDTPPRQNLPRKPKPIFNFSGHPSEGFALDWSPKLTGRMVSGDCKKNIYLWNLENNFWNVDKIPFVGHEASVEDLKWSPTEQDVFCSCSVDKTIKFWDTRGKKQPISSINAHDSDVNVLSWNTYKTFLLASGSDNGNFKVWDLRALKDGEQKVIYSFNYHESAITSITWNPNDDSSLALSSEDNSITFWDLSVTDKPENDIPPQLLFVHRGQNYIKEIHYHPQIPGTVISTSYDGFNVLKPSNI